MKVWKCQLLSRVRLFVTPWPAARQASLSVTSSQSLLNSCPSSRWCHPDISSCHPLLLPPSIFPSTGFFSHQVAQVLELQLQHESFQRISRVDFLYDLLLIPSLSKGLSRVSSSTTIWKHQFFGAYHSLWPNPHICTWLVKNHSFE